MKKILALLFAMMMVFALAACGGNDVPDPPDGGEQQSGEAGIINAADEAWVSGATNIAYVFLADGTYESYKLTDDGAWSTNGNGTYEIDGESLTLDSTAYPFSVEGDTLTFTISGTDYVYTRTAPFTAGQPTGSKLDENLILADGQAWIWDNNGAISGYVFNADGSYSYYSSSEWTLQSSGTWSTNGSSIELSYEGNRTYVINTDGLTLTNSFGDVYGPFAAQAIPSGN